MEEIEKNENKLTFAEMEQFVYADWGDKRYLLHRAANLNDFKLVKQCIQLNADVNEIDSHGCTALFYCKSIEIAKFLVDNGIDVNVLDIGGSTAVDRIYSLSKRRGSDIIKYLAGITDLENRKYNPSTLLDQMIYYQERELSLFDIVIPRIKNINKINYKSCSYLMNAAQNKNYLDVIKMLIESGIDLYLRDQDGKNFYDLAFKYVQKEIEKNYPEFMKRKDMKDQQRQRFDKLLRLNSISN